jgi:hypothetical protein
LLSWLDEAIGLDGDFLRVSLHALGLAISTRLPLCSVEELEILDIFRSRHGILVFELDKLVGENRRNCLIFLESYP